MRRVRAIMAAMAGIILATCMVTGTPDESLSGTIKQRSKVIYTSQNLKGHSVAAECNPGGTNSCPCSPEDVAIYCSRRYGEVTSNPQMNHTYVNAIGYKNFIEDLPRVRAIPLGQYSYTARVRLPVVPYPDSNQMENPQAVHLMIQLWDGRNALWESDKTTLEASIYWDLNPWAATPGKIKVYTNPVDLVDTDITLPPDTEWHTFTLVADLKTQRYVSITVDGETRDLQHLELARVFHPDWGDEVALNITTESMASWPGEGCQNIFTWRTQFANLKLLLLGSGKKVR